MRGRRDHPTSLYPKLRYGAITRAFREAAQLHTTPETAIRGVNVTTSGKTEVLLGRIEETARLDLLCDPNELAQLRWFFRDHGGPGSAFEFWLDRQTGSLWTFEDSLRDQNLLVMTLNGGGAASYADTEDGRGIVLSGAQYLSVALAQASAATTTGFDDPLDKAEGVLVVDLVPTWAGNDGVLHVILDTTGGNNRLQLRKSAANDLVLEVTDNAAGVKSKAGAVSWGANTRVRVVASWATDGTLKLWLATGAGDPTFTEFTTAAGAGTGILTSLPATLYLGANNAGANLAPGTYETLAFFKKAFPDAHRTVASYLPVWRNYFPVAELLPLGPAVLEPVRMSPGQTAFRWPFLIRNGDGGS